MSLPHRAGARLHVVDAPYDLSLTERILGEMRRAVPAEARIDIAVNTHANGDRSKYSRE